jgi:hypothetical protein
MAEYIRILYKHFLGEDGKINTTESNCEKHIEINKPNYAL